MRIRTYWPGSSAGNILANQNATVDIDLIRVCTGATIVGTVINAVSLQPIEHAAVYARGVVITPEDLPEKILKHHQTDERENRMQATFADLPTLDELERHAPRLGDIAAPDAERAIHHRRIVEDEKLFAAWRAVALH